MTYMLVTIALILAWFVWRFVRSFRDAIAEASTDVAQRWEADRNLVEVAPWFGKTGLSEEYERELSRYLRREFGEVGSADCLKAADLIYLGIQSDAIGCAHFWRIPKKDGREAYAYIAIDDAGHALDYGWGGRNPVSQHGS